MSIIKLDEAFLDTSTGTILLRQIDGDYQVYFKSTVVDSAFDAVFAPKRFPSVTNETVIKAQNNLLAYFRRRR